MSDHFCLPDAQMARLVTHFPKSHGKPRVDGRRVLSEIFFINLNGLRWIYVPREYGPHKTFFNLWKRWHDRSAFARVVVGLATEHGEKQIVMVYATYSRHTGHGDYRCLDEKNNGAVR